MKQKITITTQNYFGDHFYYTGWAALILGIPMAIANLYVGIIALLIGILVATTSYKLTIDLENHRIEDYLLILGMKKSCITKQFNRLNHITIKAGRYSQQLQLRAASTIIEGTMYSAYLMTNDENFYLGESKRKHVITKKARAIASKLNIEVKDSPLD